MERSSQACSPGAACCAPTKPGREGVHPCRDSGPIVNLLPQELRRHAMARIVRCGVIQTTCEWSPEKYSLADIKEKMIAKHEKMIATAAKKDVQVLGLQELFYGPYFCAEQNARWYELTESVPKGPTLVRMQKLAKKYKMVLVVPIYEVEMAGLFYNT